MSTISSQPIHPPVPTFTDQVPPLHSGDRLTIAEFERRYNAHRSTSEPSSWKESSTSWWGPPVSENYHAVATRKFVTWLGIYESYTPGVAVYDNGTVRLDTDNEFQPDARLRIPSRVRWSITDAR